MPKNKRKIKEKTPDDADNDDSNMEPQEEKTSTDTSIIEETAPTQEEVVDEKEKTELTGVGAPTLRQRGQADSSKKVNYGKVLNGTSRASHVFELPAALLMRLSLLAIDAISP